MESPDSDSPEEYAFLINNEVKGPMTRPEAEALIPSGEITPETLCARAGAADWKTAAEFFTFPPSALKLSARKNIENVNEERESLDPLLRKKIIHLGLASPATVDEFSPAQARAALSAYEESLRKDQKTKWFAGAGTFVGVFLASFGFGLTGLGGDFNNGVAGVFIKESEQYTRQVTRIASDLKIIAKARETLEDASRIKSPKGKPGKQFFESRVYIPAQAAVKLLFKLDYGRLAELSSEAPKIIYLRHMPANIKTEMLRQANLVWKYKHPDELQDPIPELDLAASWILFKKEAGDTLPNFVKNAEQTRLKELSSEDLSIEGSMVENLIGALDVWFSKDKESEPTPFTVYFPAKAQNFLVFSDLRRHQTTRAEALETENYAVTEKHKAGGKPYGVSVKFMNESYFIKRLTPVWYYLGVARPKTDRAATLVGVNAEEFEKTEIGKTIPTKALLDYAVFSRPEESFLSGGLSLIKETDSN
ncbi:MAG: DUF4339 domain-containing protein [Puniceicoccales bacterium]|jgi:hypothetical protein|nr:DUF4339 domain-containing protein [Puniceicoccales bacterium]